MASSATSRPRQVTLAASFIMVGSVIAVAFAFQRIAALGSIEVRESFEETLTQPPLSGTGLTVEGLTELTRILSMVVGGGATATAILGFYVLQRSRGARIGLSILAPVLFVAGLAVADLVTALVAAGVVMLWVRPISDWYAGRPITDPRAARTAARSSMSPAGSDPTAGSDPAPSPTPRADPPPASAAFPSSLSNPPAGAGEPDARPTSGFGAAPVAPATATAQPDGTRASVPSAPRPRPILAACVLTWVFSGLVVIVVGASAVALLAAPDMVLEEVRRQQPELAEENLTDGLVRTATIVVAAVVLPWCAFAVLAAVQTMRGRSWARTGLAISAGLAGAASLLALVLAGAGGAALLIALASGLTLSLLMRPESRAWFTTRS